MPLVFAISIKQKAKFIANVKVFRPTASRTRLQVSGSGKRNGKKTRKKLAEIWQQIEKDLCA